MKIAEIACEKEQGKNMLSHPLKSWLRLSCLLLVMNLASCAIDTQRPEKPSDAEASGGLEPSQSDVPIGLELVINPATDLSGDRLEVTPGAHSCRIETGQNSPQLVARIAASNALTASLTSSEVTTSGGIQRIVRFRVPAVMRIT